MTNPAPPGMILQSTSNGREMTSLNISQPAAGCNPSNTFGTATEVAAQNGAVWPGVQLALPSALVDAMPPLSGDRRYCIAWGRRFPTSDARPMNVEFFDSLAGAVLRTAQLLTDQNHEVWYAPSIFGPDDQGKWARKRAWLVATINTRHIP